MNKFMNGINAVENTITTENGATAYGSTLTALYDMFALGGSYRSRSDDDCIFLFKKAFEENEPYALKCLFYLRDVRGGQGERRFFRVCMKWLATQNIDAAKRNLKYVPEFGRWDDLYLFVGTPCQDEAFKFMKEQLALDLTCKTPSLLAKWLKSENTSSQESRDLASKTRRYLGMTSKQYRKTLSVLRERINVLERLMSAGKWDEIEFDKIPSRAGFLYKNAFARHDVERAKAGAKTYEDFAKDTTTKVNAKTLYPYECVERAREAMGCVYSWYGYKTPAINTVDRLMVNKYWENLADYINGAAFNGIAIVDTSGSMCGSGYGNRAVAPIDVAISIGMYCAEKNRGPYAGHFLTFNSQPKFMKVEGIDFCDKVSRILQAPWGGSTNIEAAFDLILQIAIDNHCSSDEIPQNLIIISDMEFNSCATSNGYGRLSANSSLFEQMRAKWETYGYKMPKLVFWNVDARQDNFAMKDEENVSYVSGFSPVLFEQIMKGKTAQDLMYDKLNDKRYACIK